MCLLSILGYYVWETNLRPVEEIIPWQTGQGNRGPGEQVILLGGGQKLYDREKNFIDSLPHGVICEF